MSAPKILYLVSEDWYFCSHRKPMARAAKKRGFTVIVLTRLNDHGDEIRAEGFRPIPLNLRRGSRNPFGAIATILDITRCYRRERPDLVHHVNLKMCLLGSVAAVFARVPRVVNALTGLGYLFTTQSTGVRLLRAVVLAGMRILNRLTAATVVVQNTDDRELVVGQRVAASEHVVLIPGSGVDTRRFSPRTPPSGVPLVTYVGRMLADKGLRELAEAARLLNDKGCSVRVVMVGPVDAENPQSLTEAEILSWVREGLLEWRGYQSDIPRIWAESTIAVLPSYREGMPKSLLEAAASAVPMVATDVPGCRALVVDGETGLLVPVRNAGALADAINRLLASPELRDIMGRNARARVEACFADDIIVDATARLYEDLLIAGQD